MHIIIDTIGISPFSMLKIIDIVSIMSSYTEYTIYRIPFLDWHIASEACNVSGTPYHTGPMINARKVEPPKI